MSRQIDPQHDAIRALLRVVGPGVVLIGVIFSLVGIGSFFSSFGSFQGSFGRPEPPQHFWCVFVGFPLLGLGGAICKFAFMGAVSRYIADEIAPVGKDVVNYMADGTQGAVRTIAAAVSEGLHADSTEERARGIVCQACSTENEASANFCKACGRPLPTSRPCPGCGELNDPSARFCDHCGKPME
jgi:hypothetical protein